MSFNVDNFVVKPSQEDLLLAKKSDLINLAKHYNLSEIKQSMRKQEIINIIVKFLIEEEIFDVEAMSLVAEETSSLEVKYKYELELKRLEADMEQKRLELEIEREEKERQEKEKERQFQIEENEKER